ncbi:MAG: hypothetical protein R6V04_08575 [bacterium]
MMFVKLSEGNIRKQGFKNNEVNDVTPESLCTELCAMICEAPGGDRSNDTVLGWNIAG